MPASGYYEWRAAEGGKQPYFISAADGAVLSIAGLWDEWKDPESGETISTATLIVTVGNDFTRPIHDRMPVLLGQHDIDAWLHRKGRPSSCCGRRQITQSLIAAGSADLLRSWFRFWWWRFRLRWLFRRWRWWFWWRLSL